MATPVRRAYLFSGQVQGVGFRMTTAQLCRDLPITGFVRNLPDGRVELVVEAPAAVLDELILRIQRYFEKHLQGVEYAEARVTGEFAEFAIRR